MRIEHQALCATLRAALPLTLLVLLALPSVGWGQQELRSGKKGVTLAAPITSTSIDVNRQGLDVSVVTTGAGEDVLKDVQRVEERWLTMPAGGSTPKISADQLYSTGAGLVKSIDCYSDATATAGTIAVLDSTVAGAGTKIFEFDVLAVAYNPTGLKQELGVPFSIGLYLDFTTTTDMQCIVRYR
jgi:hypothetical protein